MVNPSLESTIIEALNSLKEGQGESKAFHETLKADVEHIKTSLTDLCNRTSDLEHFKQNSDAVRDSQIKWLKGIVIAIGGTLSTLQAISFLKHGFWFN